jgi:ribosomal protein S18 acetylase RimI-like enzyme
MLWPATRPAAGGTSSRPDDGHSFGIQYLAVDPRWQSRGVGKQLLAASEEHARQHGCTEIHLSVYLDNARAIGLYGRMGWQRRVQDGRWQGFMFKELVGPVPAEMTTGSGSTSDSWCPRPEEMLLPVEF